MADWWDEIPEEQPQEQPQEGQGNWWDEIPAAGDEQQAANPDTGQPWTRQEIEDTKITPSPGYERPSYDRPPLPAPPEPPSRQLTPEVAEQIKAAATTEDKVRIAREAGVSEDEIQKATRGAAGEAPQPIGDESEWWKGLPEGGEEDSNKILDTITSGAAATTTGTLNLAGSTWRTPETIGRYFEGAYEALNQSGVPDVLNPFGAAAQIANKIAKGHDFGKFHAAGTSDVANRINESMDILNQISPAFKRVAEQNEQSAKALEMLIAGDTELLWAVAKDPEAWAAALGQGIPTLLAAWKSGGSMAFMGWMEAMEQAGSIAEFEKRTGQKISAGEYAAATAATGMINAMFEKTGLDAILGRLPGGKNIIAKLITAMGVEGGTEFMQEVVQNASSLIYDEEAVDKLNEAVDDGDYEAIATQLTEGGLSAAMGGIGLGGGGAAIGSVAERISAQQEGRKPPPAETFAGRTEDVSLEEMAEMGIESRDVSNDLLRRAAAGEPLTEEDMFNLEREGVARIISPEEGRVSLTPSGRRRLAGEQENKRTVLDQRIRQSRTQDLKDISDAALRQQVRTMGDIESMIKSAPAATKAIKAVADKDFYALPEGTGMPILSQTKGEGMIAVSVDPQNSLQLTKEAFGNLQPEEIEFVRREGYDSIISAEGEFIALDPAILIYAKGSGDDGLDEYGFTKESKADFEALADAQRGKPESAMRRAQDALGSGGVMSVMVEHLGDLTHRMAERYANEVPDQGLEFVRPKVARGVHYLKSPYGFEREFRENMKANYEYQKEAGDLPEGIETQEDWNNNVDKALLEYADEHRKLEVYNEPQKLARDIAVSLGEQDFGRTVELLEKLDVITEDLGTWLGAARRHPSQTAPRLARNRRRTRAPSGEFYQDRYKVRGDVPVGSPPQVKDLRGVMRLVNKFAMNVRHAEGIDTGQLPLVPIDSWDWYKDAGDLVRRLSNGDVVEMEKIVRLLAYMSPNTTVETNITKWITAIYSAYKEGRISDLTKIPGALMGSEELVAALNAKEVSQDIKGVGPKVLNFYQNLWDSTFQQDRYPDAVTIDLWMGRIFNFNTPDKLTPGQYEFAHKVVVDATHKYNDTHNTDYRPRQFQAAMWVLARGGSRGSFADIIRGSSANAAFETVPSEAFNEGRVLARMTDKQRVEYTEEMLDILDDGPRNALLDALGLPLYVTQQMRGAYAGSTAPGALMEAPLLKAAEGYDREMADLIARSLQYIYKQDSVIWYRPITGETKSPPSPNEVGYDQAYTVQFDKALTSEDIGVLAAMLDQYFPGQGFTVSEPNELTLINLDGVDPETGNLPAGEEGSTGWRTQKGRNNKKWVEGVENWIRQASTPFGIVESAMTPLTVESSGYRRTEHDWQKDPHGEGLRLQLQAQRPDLLTRLDDWQRSASKVASRWTGRAKTSTREVAASIPMDRLDHGGQTQVEIFGRFGSLIDRDTTQDLKIYNLRRAIDSPQDTIDKMLDDYGYQVDTFSYNPERFKLSNFKKKSYDDGWVWIYDPEEDAGSFKDVEYTRAWRVSHEVGHAITESLMEEKYGQSHRYGRMGRSHMMPRGVPGKQVLVEQRPLTLTEAQRAIEWEDLAFRAQRMLLERVGIKISEEQFTREYNTNIADAVYRTVTGEFGDPGEYGFQPTAATRASIKSILSAVGKTETNMAKQMGRQPTKGIDLKNWSRVSDADIRAALDTRLALNQAPAQDAASADISEMRLSVSEDGHLVVKTPPRFSRKADVAEQSVEEKYGKNVDAMMNEWLEGTEMNPLNPSERVVDWKAAATISPYDVGVIHLASIRAFEIHKGDGGRALKHITALADKHGVTLQLSPAPFGETGLGREQLKDWYWRNGFTMRFEAPFVMERSPKKVTLFSRQRTNEGKGLGREAVQNAVRQVYRRMNSAPRVIVVETVEDLPMEIYRGFNREPDPERAKEHTRGIYDMHGIMDTVYLIGSNLNTEQDAVDTLIHEIVGHYGTQGVLSTHEWGQIMDRIWDAYPDLVRKAAKRNGINIGQSATQRRIAAEEVVAYYTEQVSRGKTIPEKMRQIIEDLVEMFSQFFRRTMGKNHGITKRQIRGIIAEGWNFVHRPGGYKHQVVRMHRNHRYSMYSPFLYSALNSWAGNLTEIKKGGRTAEQWQQELQAAVKKGLIKQDEINWSGLETFLEAANYNDIYRGFRQSTDGNGRLDGHDQLFHLYPDEKVQTAYWRKEELNVDEKFLKDDLTNTLWPSSMDRTMVSPYERVQRERLTGEILRGDLEASRAAVVGYKEHGYVEGALQVGLNDTDAAWAKARKYARQWALIEEEASDLNSMIREYGNRRATRIPIEVVQNWISANGVDVQVTGPTKRLDGNDAKEMFDVDYPDSEENPDQDWDEWLQERAQDHLDNVVGDDRELDSGWMEAAQEMFDEYGDEDGGETLEDYASQEESEIDIRYMDGLIQDVSQEWDDDYNKTKTAYYQNTYEGADIEVTGNRENDEFDLTIDGFMVNREIDFDQVRDEIESYFDNEEEVDDVKWETYVLPGGEDYGETLLRWDINKDIFEASGHWDDISNILVHLRHDIRRDADGNKVFFIDEIQSDWHQELRDQGVKDPRLQTALREQLYAIHKKYYSGHRRTYEETIKEAFEEMSLVDILDWVVWGGLSGTGTGQTGTNKRKARADAVFGRAVAFTEASRLTDTSPLDLIAKKITRGVGNHYIQQLSVDGDKDPSESVMGQVVMNALRGRSAYWLKTGDRSRAPVGYGKLEFDATGNVIAEGKPSDGGEKIISDGDLVQLFTGPKAEELKDNIITQALRILKTQDRIMEVSDSDFNRGQVLSTAAALDSLQKWYFDGVNGRGGDITSQVDQSLIQDRGDIERVLGKTSDFTGESSLDATITADILPVQFEIEERRDKLRRAEEGLEPAPFEKTYHLLALKWALGYAKRQGIKKVAIANGEVHGFRWNAATLYSSVEVQSGKLESTEAGLKGREVARAGLTPRDRQYNDIKADNTLFRDSRIAKDFTKAEKQGYKGTIREYAQENYDRIYWVVTHDEAGEPNSRYIVTKAELAGRLGPQVAKLVLEKEELQRSKRPLSATALVQVDAEAETGRRQSTSSGLQPSVMTGSRAIYNEIQPNTFTNKLLKKFGAKVVWGPLKGKPDLKQGMIPYDEVPLIERIEKREKLYRIKETRPTDVEAAAIMRESYGTLVEAPDDQDFGKYRKQVSMGHPQIGEEGDTEGAGQDPTGSVVRYEIYAELASYGDARRAGRSTAGMARWAPVQNPSNAPKYFLLASKEEYDDELKRLATDRRYILQRRSNANDAGWVDESHILPRSRKASRRLFMTENEARKVRDRLIRTKLEDESRHFGAWTIEITPKLDQQLQDYGLPLFSRNPIDSAPDERKDGLRELDEKIAGDPSSSLQRFQNSIFDIIKIDNKRAKIEQSFADQFAGIKHALKAYYGKEELPPEIDPYKHAHLTTSADSQMFVALMNGSFQWQDGATQIKPDTKGLLQILEPIGKKVDLWGKFMVSRRAKRLYLEGIKKGSPVWFNLRQHFGMTRAPASRPTNEQEMRDAAWEDIIAKTLPTTIHSQIKNSGRENLLTAEAIESGMWLGEQNPMFETVADEYAGFMKDMLDWAEAAGVINAETRPLWESADYIPFYRLRDNDLGAGFDAKSGTVAPSMTGRTAVATQAMTRGIANQRSPIRQLRGGESKLGNPLENILINLNQLMQTTMRNHAAVLTIDALEGSGLVTPVLGKEFMEQKTISTSDLKRRLKTVGIDVQDMDQAALGAIKKMWVIDAPKDPNVITILRDGKKKYYHIHDEVLFRALTAINQRHFQTLFGSMAMAPFRFAKRLLTSMITLSPAFMGANYMRDGPMAFVNSRYAKNPNFVRSLQSIGKAIKLSPEMLSMMAAGGAFYSGYINAGDPAAMSKALRRAIRQSGVRGKILNSPLRLANAYNDIAAAMENSNRIAFGYIPAVKSTGSIVEGVYESKDLMNFAKHGDMWVTQFFIQTVPFLNARLQGLLRYGNRQLGEGKSAAGATLLKAMLVMLPTMFLYWSNRDDERYKQLTQEDKDLYWHAWPLGYHMRIPKPFEVGALFATTPERIWEWMESDADDAGKLALDRLGWVIGEMFNFDLRQIQLLNPMIESARNYNSFFRGSIVPYYLEKADPRYQYTERTSPLAREIAESMPYDWAMLPDFLESPMIVEHLMRGYFGTLGTYIMTAVDTQLRATDKYASGPAMRWDQLPVIKRFFRGYEPPIRYETDKDGKTVMILPSLDDGEQAPRRTAYESMMYDFRSAAMRVEETMRDIIDDERVPGSEEAPYLAKPARQYPGLTNEQVLDAIDDVKASSSAIRDLRKELDEIVRDKRYSPEQKAYRMEKIYREIQREAIEWYIERPGSGIPREERPRVMTEEQWELRQNMTNAEIIKWLGDDYPVTAELVSDVSTGGLR